MSLRLTLAALAVLTAARVVGTVAPTTSETAALATAADAYATEVATRGPAGVFDDAVRIGMALVPARVAVGTAPGGASRGLVRTTGPGGAPVVASASVTRH